MKEPRHVARCVEGMKCALKNLYHSRSDADIRQGQGFVPLSVKHRLGVRDAATYDAVEDRRKDDLEEVSSTARDVVQTVTFSGDVKKFQVHARLGLLGDFEPSTEAQTVATSSLWVPGVPLPVRTTPISIPPLIPTPPPKPPTNPSITNEYSNAPKKQPERQPSRTGAPPYVPTS